LDTIKLTCEENFITWAQDEHQLINEGGNRIEHMSKQ
jgi:hypothetical protein